VASQRLEGDSEADCSSAGAKKLESGGAFCAWAWKAQPASSNPITPQARRISIQLMSSSPC
jgi:hypothetical protein